MQKKCARCTIIQRRSRKNSISRRTILSLLLLRLKMGGGAASCSMRNGACQAGIYSRVTLYICFECGLALMMVLALIYLCTLFLLLSFHSFGVPWYLLPSS